MGLPAGKRGSCMEAGRKWKWVGRASRQLVYWCSLVGNVAGCRWCGTGGKFAHSVPMGLRLTGGAISIMPVRQVHGRNTSF